MSLHAVIMAGGSGTRFWPKSTPSRPKQFLNLTGDASMLELTVRRLEGLVQPGNAWVLTGKRYAELALSQAKGLGTGRIVGEPMARDTAAAVALGAGLIQAVDPDGVMMLLPADHAIQDRDGFQNTMRQAAELAEQGRFVTVGIRPLYPAEIYGYLQIGEQTGEKTYRLKRFVEKPPRETAEAYLKEGGYYWNAGMFLWKASAVLEQMDRFLPEHATMARRLGKAWGQDDWDKLALEEFEKLEKISIDYGLMEKLDEIVMVEAGFDWNDVGGWAALADLIGADPAGNVIQGKAVCRDSNNNILVTDPDRPLVVSGLSNCVVVSAEAGTLISSMESVERIKSLVNEVLEG